MKVTMNLERATHHVENTKALKLTEVDFKIKPNMKEHKRLFRPSLYELTIISEVNNQMYEFEGYQLDHKLISQLEKDPSTFLVGAEPLSKEITSYKSLNFVSGFILILTIPSVQISLTNYLNHLV